MKNRLAKKILTCKTRLSKSYSHVVKARSVSKNWKGWLSWPKDENFRKHWVENKL